MTELLCTGYNATSARNIIGWDRQPSWLVEDPVSGTVFALGEETEGCLGVFRRTSSGWELTSTHATLGAHPCHASLVGRTLVVSHYGDGVVSCFDVADDGDLHPARILVDESDGAHGHCITGRGTHEILITDLGLAKVTWGRLPTATAPWAVLGELNLDVTTGPRHLALHPSLPLAYLITEYSNELVVVTLGPSAGHMAIRERRSTLPSAWLGSSFGSAIRVSPDGRFVLAANRGHDSLVSFALNSSGDLGESTHVPCGGSWPRDLLISGDGHHVAVANQKSGWVSLFARNPANGALVPDENPQKVEGANSLLFISRTSPSPTRAAGERSR